MTKNIYIYILCFFTPTCLLAKYSIYTYHLPLSWICLRGSFLECFLRFTMVNHHQTVIWENMSGTLSKHLNPIHVPMLLQDYTLYLQISGCFVELICSAIWDLGKLETRSRVNEVLGSGDGLFRSVFVECDIPIDIKWERRHTNVLRSMINCFSNFGGQKQPGTELSPPDWMIMYRWLCFFRLNRFL